jgi:hypothetical protein
LHAFGDGANLKRRIAEKDLDHIFLFFEDFIDDATYHSYIQRSDIIMPLLHGREKRYLGKLIPGSINLAFAYKIPLLIENEFSQFHDFATCGFSYTMDNIVPILNDLSTDPGALEVKRNQILTYPKFAYEYQKKNYITFLEKI